MFTHWQHRSIDENYFICLHRFEDDEIVSITSFSFMYWDMVDGRAVANVDYRHWRMQNSVHIEQTERESSCLTWFEEINISPNPTVLHLIPFPLFLIDDSTGRKLNVTKTSSLTSRISHYHQTEYIYHPKLNISLEFMSNIYSHCWSIIQVSGECSILKYDEYLFDYTHLCHIYVNIHVIVDWDQSNRVLQNHNDSHVLCHYHHLHLDYMFDRYIALICLLVFSKKE